MARMHVGSKWKKMPELKQMALMHVGSKRKRMLKHGVENGNDVAAAQPAESLKGSGLCSIAVVAWGLANEPTANEFPPRREPPRYPVLESCEDCSVFR